MSEAITSSPGYWCYRCNRSIQVHNQDSIVCPECDSGFIEEIDSPLRVSTLSESRRRRFPSTAMHMIGNSVQNAGGGPMLRRIRGNSGDRSPFNPVIVPRGGASGLRPLPPTMSEFLLGSGFDRLLDPLSQIEINGIGRSEQSPASKAAIESMPTVEIVESHIEMELHCAVCKELFELSSEARGMPCRHIYHSDCILPWLAFRNTCPVCRHELPSDNNSTYNNIARGASPVSDGGLDGGHGASGNEETVGLTIRRLPGGGFTVRRFSGGRREAGIR